MPRGERRSEKLSIKSQICYYYDFGFASVIRNENEKSTNLTRHTLDADCPKGSSRISHKSKSCFVNAVSFLFTARSLSVFLRLTRMRFTAQ